MLLRVEYSKVYVIYAQIHTEFVRRIHNLLIMIFPGEWYYELG